MAIISGSATNFTDLRDTVIANLVLNGWSAEGIVVGKGSSYFELATTTNFLQIYGGTGQTGGILSGVSPYGARLGGTFMTFPVNFDLYIFDAPDECYLVVNYNSSHYQQLSFGTSNIDGAGYGPWFTGPSNSTYGPGTYNGLNLDAAAFGTIRAYAYGNTSAMSFGLFNAAIWSGEVTSSFAYTNANGTPGWYGCASGANTSRLNPFGAASFVAGLLGCSPSQLNGGIALLPIKAMLSMGNNGNATVVCPSNARFCRLDNHVSGEIITFGSEQWKLYPWLRREPTVRNGVNNATGVPPNHSGTFGFAIRH